MIVMLMTCTRMAVIALLASTAAACVAERDPAGEPGEARADPVIGGVRAVDIPEAVLLDMFKNGRLVSACSGAVIAPRVVLTAGHCVFGYDGFSVRAPFAGNQTAKSTRGIVFDYNVTSKFVDATRHDVGLVILSTSIRLATYPTLARSKVPDGTRIMNVGRIDDGVFSNSALFQSEPIQVKDATSFGFPFDYIAVERIQPGDSGGPDLLVDGATGGIAHTIVAVNSGSSDGIEVLARVDLVADLIERVVSQNGGS